MVTSKKNKFAKEKYSFRESGAGFALGAFLVLGVFIYSLYSFAAWTNPTAAPPNNNVPEPINTGTSTQSKLGSFKLGTTTAPASVSNFYLYNGKAAFASSTLGATTMLVSSPAAPNVNVVDLDTNRIVGLATVPINNNEAASKFYVDWAASSSKFWTGTMAGKVWNLNTGNIGIGTNNPSQKLDVNGILNVGTAVNTGSIYIGTSQVLSATAAPNTLSINGGGFTNVVVPSGNVGIGTTNPGGFGSGATGPFLNVYNGGTGATNVSELYLGNAATVSGQVVGTLGFVGGASGAEKRVAFIVGGTDAAQTAVPYGNLAFYTANGAAAAERMRIDELGNVGIGTTKPGEILTTNVASGKNVHRLTVGGSFEGALGIEGGGSYITGSAANDTFMLAQNNLLFGTGGSTERMRITSGGNVGIGTTNPLSLLHVNGNMLLGSGLSGDAGNYTLSTSLNSNAVIILQGADANHQIKIDRHNNAITMREWVNIYANYGIDNGNDGAFIFQSGPSANETMRITAAGNVGIGTSNPASKLHVYGASDQPLITAQTGIFRIESPNTGLNIGILSGGAPNGTYIQTTNTPASGGGAYVLLLNPKGGNVGIGTTNPGAYSLYVVGDQYVTGQVTAGSGDVAEDFYTDKTYPAGTVLVMGDKGYKSARACNKQDDPTVIGVISAQPGMVVGNLDGKYVAPVALTGVIKVRINATGGKIHQGDLLTTSAVSGEAMKATAPQVGTAIGKALENDTGKGWVMAMVNLK